MSIKDQLLKKGFGSENLDDVVHDAASQMASNANNGGLDQQVQFLITSAGWSEDEILDAVRKEPA